MDEANAAAPTSTATSNVTSTSDFPQTHAEVVLPRTWWWITLLGLAVLALIANGLFLLTVVYNRKRPELKTFVTAVLVAVSLLDVLDVCRALPVLAETVYLEQLFRHVYCSLGLFHELAVACFLVILSMAVCSQAGLKSKHVYQDSYGHTHTYTSSSRSWLHKLVIVLVVLLSAGAAAPFYLVPYQQLFHSCMDPFRAQFVLDYESDSFWYDLYTAVVTLFTYVLPLLIIPLAIPVAYVRTCLSRQCCVARFKQPIGELIMTTVVTLVYLITVIAVILPKFDSMFSLDLQKETIPLGPAPLLWELGNNAVRPVVYFLTNPAVWEGFRFLCCHSPHRHLASYGGDEDGEDIEVPLSPVTTV